MIKDVKIAASDSIWYAIEYNEIESEEGTRETVDSNGVELGMNCSHSVPNDFGLFLLSTVSGEMMVHETAVHPQFNSNNCI